METNGVFRSGVGGMNGRYSFKSLLLDDGEGVEEAGIGVPPVYAGHMDLHESLYRDEVPIGRESFKSLLLDEDDDEVRFSSRNHKLQNGALPSVSSGAAMVGRESFKGEVVVGRAEGKVHSEETRIPPRKRRRANSSKAPVPGHLSTLALVPYKDGQRADCGQEQGPQPLRALSPLRTKKQPEFLRAMPLPRKRKPMGYTSDVQKFFDSLIARQEIFFTDLLQSMERKEEIRERIRAEKEESWRAEDRAQRGVFNNAMIALTQELLGDPLNGARQLIERGRSSDGTDH